MSKFWLIVERQENWDADRESGFSMFGISSRYQKTVERMQRGDLVIVYVSSGRSAFSDVRAVERIMKRPPLKKANYDAAFDLFIETKSHLVLDKLKWLPLKTVAGQLELTRDYRDWRPIVRTSLRPLSQNDGEFLLNQLKRLSTAS